MSKLLSSRGNIAARCRRSEDCVNALHGLEGERRNDGELLAARFGGDIGMKFCARAKSGRGSQTSARPAPACNYPAKPAMPERIEAVLQLRDRGGGARPSATTSEEEPPWIRF